MGSWLGARLRVQAAAEGQDGGRRQRRAVAVDGKALRGTRHASSNAQPVHLLAASPPCMPRACPGGTSRPFTRSATRAMAVKSAAP